MLFPRPRTVRAKLILTTTLVVGLVLVALGFLIDVGTRKTLMDTVEAELRHRAEDMAQRDRGGPHGGPGGMGPFFGLFGGGPEGQGGDRRGPFGPRPGDQDDFRPRFVHFDESAPKPTSTQGAPNPQNPPRPRETLYDPDALRAIQAGRGEVLRTVVWKGEPRRVFSLAVRRDGKAIGMVQVAYPLGDIEGSLATLRGLLVTVAIPLGMLLGAAASLFIVDRLLRPLRIITTNAQTIGAGTLEDRLPVVGDDEFAGLATTLNGMLGRLEEGFRLEQATTRRLAETVEQQRRFTADASHELKTPLSTIKAHAGLLAGLENEDDRESADAIDEAANRMRGLVDDLLVLARADGGSLTARTAPVDLADAVGAAVGAVSPLAVEVRGAPRPLVVQGNGEALTRLFINLLDNAKKYAGTDEPIEVRLGRRGDVAEIVVIDRGIGIAPEHLSRIFDRFYRPDVSRTSETGGTGLGLAICKEIATAHRGTIEVASREGQGTAFTVALPLAG